MSGTKSPLKTAPATKSLWKLALILWPFTMGAVAINLFMAGLIVQSAGWATAPAPLTMLLWSFPLGVPAAFAAARWVRSLIRQAEGG